MILFIFVMNSSHRVWTEIAEYFADRKVSMEAVKGMMELAKFKSDVMWIPERGEPKLKREDLTFWIQICRPPLNTFKVIPVARNYFIHICDKFFK